MARASAFSKPGVRNGWHSHFVVEFTAFYCKWRVHVSVGKISHKSEDTQCLWLLLMYLCTHTGVFRELDLLLDFK